ncbi:phospholipase a-2-activating protein [Anaeramoeba ignava]|uniref:Phospholipase a-2-activating protein n=1 Tax=Anaeramoeba ignava TaxID=1746090 RepID=A0A9Q0RCS7_ANAIG|nr:phospholipase a-2-activating protein [Anaeramoeba ignava]
MATEEKSTSEIIQKETEMDQVPIDRTPTSIIHGHNSKIRCFFVDDEFIYSGSFGKQIMKYRVSDSIKVWTKETPSYIFYLKTHLGDLYSSGSDIRCFNAQNGELIWSFKGDWDGYIFTFVIHNNKFYTGGKDTYIREYNFKKDGLSYISKQKNAGRVWSLEIFNDMLYSGFSDGNVKEWNLNSGLRLNRTIKCHSLGVWCIEMYEGKMITCSKDCSIKKWDINAGKELEKWEGHKQPIISSHIYNNILFTGGDGGTGFAWDLKTGKCLHKFEAEVKIWAVGATKQRLYLGTTTKKIFEYDISNLFRQKSLIKDLDQLYLRHENCDLEIATLGGKIPIHTQFVNFRLRIKDIQAYNGFFRYKKHEDVDNFFEWVYTGVSFHLRTIQEMIREMGQNQFDSINGIENLKHDLEALYHNEDSKDFTIISESKPIKVHKIILMARSDLYRGMFLSVNDDSNKVNDYSGKQFKTVNALVRYLYFDKLDNDLDNSVINELLDAESYYQLSENSNLSTEIQRLKSGKRY